MSLWEKIQSGYFESVEALITDFKFRSEDASPTSPRYERLREMLEEYEKLQELLEDLKQISE